LPKLGEKRFYKIYNIYIYSIYIYTYIETAIYDHHFINAPDGPHGSPNSLCVSSLEPLTDSQRLRACGSGRIKTAGFNGKNPRGMEMKLEKKP
jgi:hypothetical protein